MRCGKWVAIAAIVSQCAGCAWQAQSVRISPDVKAISTLSGNGKSIELSIADERTSKTIGQRGVSGVGADMTVEGDIEKIVQDAIVSGLAKHNFVASVHSQSTIPTKLRVEIRNLSSKNIMGFWAGTLRDEFALKAVCKPASGEEYQKLYNGVFETSIQVVPTGDANNRYVSNAVADGVSQLVNDDALLTCLADSVKVSSASP